MLARHRGFGDRDRKIAKLLAGGGQNTPENNLL
jgi:hypothetical protein